MGNTPCFHGRVILWLHIYGARCFVHQQVDFNPSWTTYGWKNWKDVTKSTNVTKSTHPIIQKCQDNIGVLVGLKKQHNTHVMHGNLTAHPRNATPPRNNALSRDSSPPSLSLNNPMISSKKPPYLRSTFGGLASSSNLKGRFRDHQDPTKKSQSSQPPRRKGVWGAQTKAERAATS